MSKTKLRSIIPNRDTKEAVQHFIDLGFRFLNRFLNQTQRYKFLDLHFPGKLAAKYHQTFEEEFKRLSIAAKASKIIKKEAEMNDVDDVSSTSIAIEEDDWEVEMRAKVYALHGNALLVTFVEFFCGKLGFTKDDLLSNFDEIRTENFLKEEDEDEMTEKAPQIPEAPIVSVKMSMNYCHIPEICLREQAVLDEWQVLLNSQDDEDSFGIYNFRRKEADNNLTEKTRYNALKITI